VYRWSSITRRLWAARNFGPVAIAANLGYRFYAHNLHRFYTCDWPITLLPQRAASASLASDNKFVCG
jgi:hypothetical protein